MSSFAPCILVLGGSEEGYQLASACFNSQTIQASGMRVVSSLAGRTSQPRKPAGEIRIGGFGGVTGLQNYLQDNHVSAVIDATHPFATQMGLHAWQTCQILNIPLLRFTRPAWQPAAHDIWTEYPNWKSIRQALEQGSANRVFLALGRQELHNFADIKDIFFLIRVINLPEPLPCFPHVHWLTAKGPFSIADELQLLTDFGIDTLICKNSGGNATFAKLEAARTLQIPVLMHARPSRPETPTVYSLENALIWLENLHKNK